MRGITALLFLALFVSACRKKDDPATPGANLGKVSFTFANVAGSKPLVLDNEWYLTENGDSLKVSIYKYYITNIVLHTDSSEFKEWESYYLIDESKPASKSFTVDSIPLGKYNKVSFLIGVDERRNKAGAQTGALDPINTMFWDWNTGYIMAKLEGISPQSAIVGKTVSYHIAGFQTGNSVIRKVTLNLPQPLEVNGTTVKNIHLKSDMLEWFKTPRTIKIEDTYVIGSEGAEAVRMADNYADMFTIDHVD